MDILSIPSNPKGQALPVVRKGQAAAAAIPQPKVEFDPVTVQQQVPSAHAAEKQRLDTVLKAAKMFRDVYAVSDTSFSIFKDASGQFITRFTSLKDGSVTYIPEPDMLAHVQVPVRLEIDA